MMGKLVSWGMVMAALVTSCSAADGLGYHLQVGNSYHVVVQTVATLPVVGNQTIKSEYSFQVDGVQGDLSGLSMQLAPIQLPSGMLAGCAGSFDLQADGCLSSLQSPGLTNPRLAPFVKNVSSLFIPLPDRKVELGHSWSSTMALHLPPRGMADKLGMKGMLLPATVVLAARYTFVEQGQLHPIYPDPVAQVAVSLQSLPDQGVELELVGQSYHCLESGFCVGSAVGGTMKVKKLGLTVAIPVKIITLTLQ